jgi:hypothetical protein
MQQIFEVWNLVVRVAEICRKLEEGVLLEFTVKECQFNGRLLNVEVNFIKLLPTESSRFLQLQVFISR